MNSLFPSLTSGDLGYLGSSLTELTSDSEGLKGERNTSEERIDKNDDSEDEDGGDDDDDIEWEDVFQATIESTPTTSVLSSSKIKGNLQLTLHNDRTGASISGKKKGVSARERRIRVVTHCLHVQFLLFHGALRNGWLCDPELHAILLSHLTPSIMKDIERFQLRQGKKLGKEVVAKVVIDPIPELLRVLIHWWKKKFIIDKHGMKKNGYKTLLRLRDEEDGTDEKFRFINGNKGPNGEDRYTLLRNQGEKVENLDEFRKLAMRCKGSRDTGAMLFTGLLRAVGLEARMVFSLQPLGFGFTERENFTEVGSTRGRTKEPLKNARTKGNHRSKGNDITGIDEKSEDDGGYDSDASGGFVRGGPALGSYHKPKRPAYDKDLLYPIFWSEVYLPTSDTWITVESLVLTVLGSSLDLLAKFEPKGKKATDSKQTIAYVIAYSTDGTAKDVTVRYLAKNNFPGKTKGFRIPTTDVPVYGYEGSVMATHKQDWFDGVMRGYRTPEHLRTEKDKQEDEELQRFILKSEKVTEEKRESISYYKNNPRYILERHLKREEAVRLGKRHIKMFIIGKGEKAKEEKVYSRNNIVVCKTIENWYREGRVVSEGQQPLKRVKPRAATLNRKREIGEAQRGGDTVVQGLYSEEQTKLYSPPPVVGGKIRRNSFGNIDIYVPSMIPLGAVHLPLKGCAKLARRLGIDYAEAVTGFEFKKQRAVPVVEGIITAAENEDLLRDAWRAEQKDKRKMEDRKREKAALAIWRRFLMGLRIVKYLRDEYGDVEDGAVDVNPFTVKKLHRANLDQSYREEWGKEEGNTGDQTEESGGLFRESEGRETGGGFIGESGNDVGEGEGILNDGEETISNGHGFEIILDDDEPTAPRKDDTFTPSAKALLGAMSLRDMVVRRGKQTSVETAGSGFEEPQQSTTPPGAKSKYSMGVSNTLHATCKDEKPKIYSPSLDKYSKPPSRAENVKSHPRTRVEVQIPIAKVIPGRSPQVLQSSEAPVPDEASDAQVPNNDEVRRVPKRKAAAQAEWRWSKYFIDEGEDLGGERKGAKCKRGKIAKK